jgi:hypothetical protein
MGELTQGDLDRFANLVNAGNYTQFYYELYQAGSAISGLYIPDPTGQGIFGNYSHEHVREAIGREIFDADRAVISNTIARGLLQSIQDTRDQQGTYRLLSDVEFLEAEIRIFTEDLGYPQNAYPGHELIEFLGLNVNSSVDGMSALYTDELMTLLNAWDASEKLYFVSVNGEYIPWEDGLRLGYRVVEQIDPNSGIKTYSYRDPNDDSVQAASGVFTYRDQIFSSNDIIEENGVLFVLFDDDNGTVKIPVGISTLLTLGLLTRIGELHMCFATETPILLPDGTTKPIEDIRPGDIVQSYDATGSLAGRVTRTFRNTVSHILDVHGLKVTPGHATLCGAGMFAGRHVPIIDILLSDGALVQADGTLIRVAINQPMGSVEDHMVQVAYALTPEDVQTGTLAEGETRVGTLLFDRDGVPVSVLDCVVAEGYAFDPETGLIAKPGEAPHPLFWFGKLPRPEDYILTRSRETLEGILTDGEWEGGRSALIEGRLRQVSWSIN